MTSTDKALRLLGLLAAWNLAVWSVSLAVIFLAETGGHQRAHLSGVPAAVVPVLLSVIGSFVIFIFGAVIAWGKVS